MRARANGIPIAAVAWVAFGVAAMSSPGVRRAVAQSVTPASTAVLDIYLARHGQTDWNVAHRIQGSTDIPLNDTGRGQARQLAERLSGVALDGIYSSALRRSRETALIVAGERRVTSLAGLNEQSVGRFQGLYLDGRDPALQAEYSRRKKDPDDDMDGGESQNDLLARVRKSLERICAEHPAGHVLIVGHGGTNEQVLRALLGLTAAEAREIHQENSELYLIRLAPGAPPGVWKLIPRHRLDEL